MPAAARIVASGVRKSCETDWSRADFSASLWRAISAACDSAARRSWASACPSWSAAPARSRVSVAVGGPLRSRSRSAQTEPNSASAGLDPDPVHILVAGAPRLAGRQHDERPGGGLVARTALQDADSRAGCPGPAGVRIGRNPLVPGVRAEAYPYAAHPRLASQRGDDLGQGGLGGFPGRKDTRYPEQCTSLTLAVLGRTCPCPLPGRELTDDDPREQQQHDAEECLRVRDRQCVERRREEPVVDKEREHRRGDGSGGSGGEAAHDDRDEIDDRCVLDADPALEDAHGAGGDDDGRDGPAEGPQDRDDGRAHGRIVRREPHAPRGAGAAVLSPASSPGPR